MSLADCLGKLKAEMADSPNALDPGIEAGIQREVRRELRAQREALKAGTITKAEAQAKAEAAALDRYLGTVQEQLAALDKPPVAKAVDAAAAPKAAEVEHPDVAAVRQRIAEADFTFKAEDGRTMKASEAFAEAEALAKQGETEAGAFRAAVTCFLGG
jgi:electron transfer flavoprotein alpha subunit